MIRELDFYYFSPTGGTRRVGEIIAEVLATRVVTHNLAERTPLPTPTTGELALLALPVFAGRIPEFCADKIGQLNGSGKTAVTVVVYGNRAYEDALLELNQAVRAAGFRILGSAAAVARHSMVPAVAADRPDPQDVAELRTFARQILNKIRAGNVTEPVVPGNFPYKPPMTIPATPISLESCSRCGKCAEVCPTGAITITPEAVTTSMERCLLCLACVAGCPIQARILPPPLQEAMNRKLSPLQVIRRENEFFQ